MLFVIMLLAFLSVMLLVLGLATPTRPAAPSFRDRIGRISQATEDSNAALSLSDAQFHASFGDRIVRPMLLRLAVLTDRLLPGKSPEALRLALSRAGNPGGLGVAEFNGLRLICLIVFFVSGFLVAHTLAGAAQTRVLTFIVCLIAGIVLPDTLLQQKTTKRQALIRKALPDTIDLLIVSVEAGMGFDGAISKVVEKTKGPLTEELALCLDEIRVGKMRGDALKDMAARIDIPEITSFVAAVYQADQLGVSIARVLHVQSEAIRTARVQRIREIAAKLPVKMLFPLVFFIFPAIFVVLLGPGFLHILKAF